MLNGLLVDLVPYGKVFGDLQHQWLNSEASFWGSAGDRLIAPRTKTDRWYQEWRERSEQGTGGPEFGICTKDGTPIGDIGVNTYWPHHRTANIGAGIGDPAYWGGGYGTDALLLVVDHFFNWLDLRKIWLDTMSLNARVIRQMEKVGFTLEARLRHGMLADGVWQDELVYGLLRDEWPGYAEMVQRVGLKVRKPE